MNRHLPFGIGLVLSVVLLAAGWWTLPILQGEKRTVDTEASREIERARRLLHQYDAGLKFKSLLTGQIASYIEEIDPQDLSETAADEYQRLHEALWESYSPMDWERGSPVRANYGNLAGQIRDGLGAMANAASRNERFLDQALSAIDRALAISSGDESARTDPEANRLKAVALYHKGLTRRIEADVLRREADQIRRELVTLAGEAADAEAAVARLRGSGIPDDVADLEREADDLMAAIEQDGEAADETQEIIDDLEARLAERISQRDEARRAIEELRAAGADPTDPAAARRYGEELAAWGAIYRTADREVRAIEFGTYDAAELDFRGDLRDGTYVDIDTRGEPEIRPGLAHYRDRHRLVTAAMERRQRRLDEVRDTIAALESLGASIADQQEWAHQRAHSARQTASEAFAELRDIESEAFTIEEDALNLLDRAAGAAKSAAGYARLWPSEARTRTQNLSPEARGRSAFEERSKAGWIEAYIGAQEADARFAKALIYYARFRFASQNEVALARVATVLQLAGADAAAESEKARHAHDVGVAEISQAMSVLEQSHRGSGRHWTLAAQAAGTTYLLALFGHEDYVSETIQAYRAALSGRESDSVASAFVTRLAELDGR